MIIGQNTLILGIGNTLLSDEGAGIHALNLMKETFDARSDLTFLDGGTLSFSLACWIEECHHLIVFDAAELHAPPGTVTVFAGSDMDAYLGAAKRSAHEVGLLDLMDIARLTDHLPVNRALIGIQPQVMDWGMQPTEEVGQALPEAVDQAASLLRLWAQPPLIRAKPAARQHHLIPPSESPKTGA
jgi:hydrogenase maturation protease